MSAELYLIIGLSILGTYVWRLAGVFFAQKIDPDGQVFIWLGCVAYALLAGLMSRVLVFPVGLLADTSILARLLPMAAGFFVFFLFGRSFFAATIVAALGFYLLISQFPGF